MRATIFALPTIFLLITGCGNTVVQPTYQGIDSDRLLHLAGHEAGEIASARERLARQFNIANRETSNGHSEDARKTLIGARQTLESAGQKDFTDHERLAGWISLSELNREAADVNAAGASLDKAIEYLNKLLPVYARPEYVHGIAREVNALRGEKESAKLIAAAANWVVEMPQEPTRRQALVSFCYELFRCNDYENAVKMLQCEKDASWRSDTLIAMSDRERSIAARRSGGIFNISSESSARQAPADSSTLIDMDRQFGKQLDFKSNFRSNK